MNQLPLDSHPERYRHWRLDIDVPCAVLRLAVREDAPHGDGYELALNSFDLGVEIELADAVERIRFEHPEVRTLVITSGRDDLFGTGANVAMLAAADDSLRVNYYKFANETRFAIEDAHESSGLRTIAALNGTASGGAYELALACEWIILRDDESCGIALPELALLGILPGTGGLTRLVDKRRVRRDLVDALATRASGVRGWMAEDWRLVDEVVPTANFDATVAERARDFAEEAAAMRADRDRSGVTLRPIEPAITGSGARYRHVTVHIEPEKRTGEITVHAPDEDLVAGPDEIRAAGSNWPPLAIFRELDHALLELRFHHPEIGVLTMRTEGDPGAVLRMDHILREYQSDWFVREVRHYIKRTLKRLDHTARSIIALVEPGSCFVGTFLELALAADRSFVRDDPEAPPTIRLTPLNAWAYPKANGLSRLATHLSADPDDLDDVLTETGDIPPRRAAEMGLVTFAVGADDWEATIRTAIEERTRISPDGLTALEANLRLAGPDTLETRILDRLSAWQNWILSRPNATGKRGSLATYGGPDGPEIDWRRT